MAEKKLIALVQRLNKRTREGKVVWERTVDDGVYQASFPGYAVRISTRPTRDSDAPRGSQDIVLEIYNDQGELIEEVSDLDFSGGELSPSPFNVMDEIYTKARRTAMGYEQAIDTLLSVLEDEGGS